MIGGLRAGRGGGGGGETEGGRNRSAGDFTLVPQRLQNSLSSGIWFPQRLQNIESYELRVTSCLTA